MSDFFRYSAETTKALADSMDRRGFACLTDYLSESDLEQLRFRVSDAGLDPTGKYAALQDRKTFGETALTKIPATPDFQHLCRQLLALATDGGTGETTELDFYQVVRCLNGDVGRKNSYIFHYDTYVLTVLIPIMIPQAGERGDLVLFPNVRGIRRSYLRNIFDKFLVDNQLAQWALKLAAKRKICGATAVVMKPGNIYLFWGYRTIHANEPCDPDQVRATALLHFGDPYKESRTRSFLRRARRLAAA
jgi:hypothetical protein